MADVSEVIAQGESVAIGIAISSSQSFRMKLNKLLLLFLVMLFLIGSITVSVIDQEAYQRRRELPVTPARSCAFVLEMFALLLLCLILWLGIRALMATSGSTPQRALTAVVPLSLETI